MLQGQHQELGGKVRVWLISMMHTMYMLGAKHGYM